MGNPLSCGASAVHTKRVASGKRRRICGPLGETEADKLPLLLRLDADLPTWAKSLLMTPVSAQVDGADVLVRSPRAVGRPLVPSTTADGCATLSLMCMGMWALQHFGRVIHNDSCGNTLVERLASPLSFEALLPDGRGKPTRCTVHVAAGVGWPRTYDFGASYRGRGMADALEIACRACVLSVGSDLNL